MVCVQIVDVLSAVALGLHMLSREMLNILLGLLLSSVGVVYNCRRHQLLTDVAQESVTKSYTGSGSTLIRIN